MLTDNLEWWYHNGYLHNSMEFQLTIYGDSIYPRLSHLKSSFRHQNLQEWQKEENRRYAKVRISIEWNYMVTGNLFGYVTNTQKLKILGSNNVAKVYTVATLLRNCHVAMYGSETSHYFELPLSTNIFREVYESRGLLKLHYIFTI